MHSLQPASRRPRTQQRGAVLVLALIIMVVMLFGAAAMVRSFGTSMQATGQLTFRRDLMNRGERGLAVANTALLTGALNTEPLRSSNLLSANYFASVLPSNNQGIPLLLLNDGSFTGTATDISESGGITIRYVIDRQCTGTGTADPSSCVSYTAPLPSASGGIYSGGDSSAKPKGETKTVYRISVRVQGPRNTTAFLQRLVSI